MNNPSEKTGKPESNPPVGRVSEKKRGFKEDNPWEKYDSHKLYLGTCRHKWLIALCAIFWALIGGWLGYKSISTYKAEATVLYQQDALPKSLPLGEAYSLTNLSFATVQDMIKTPRNLVRVKGILGLAMPISQLNDLIEVPLPKFNSDLIQIICKSDNQNLAIDIANTAAKVAVQDAQNYQQDQLRAVLASFVREIEDAKTQLSENTTEIEVFRRDNQYFEMSSESSLLLQQIALVQQRLREEEWKHQQYSVEYDNLRKEVKTLPDQVSLSYELRHSAPLQNHLSNLESTLAQARSKYSSNNPKLKQLEAELESLVADNTQEKGQPTPEGFLERNTLKDQLTIEIMKMLGQVRSSERVRKSIHEKLVDLEGHLEQLPQQQMVFAKLLHIKKMTETKLEGLTLGLEKTQLMLNVPRGNLEIYQLATVPQEQMESFVPLFLFPLFFACFGVCFGLGCSLLVELRDPKIRTKKQLEMLFPYPCLAVAPEMSLFTPKNSFNRFLYYIRLLADRLDSYFQGEKSVTIGFTSALVGEGKTTWCHHLATYYSKHCEKKVLVLEFDYHDNSYIEEDSSVEERSLEKILDGQGEWKEMISSGIYDRLYVSTKVSNLNELIKGSRMEELYASLKEAYDVILIDTPGVIEEVYSASLLKLVDVCLIVIDSSRTESKLVGETIDKLKVAGVEPAGMILNNVMILYVDDEGIKREQRRHRSEVVSKVFSWGKRE